MFTLALSRAVRAIFLDGLSFATLRYWVKAKRAPSRRLTTKRPSLFLWSVRLSLLTASLPDFTSASLSAITA